MERWRGEDGDWSRTLSRGRSQEGRRSSDDDAANESLRRELPHRPTFGWTGWNEYLHLECDEVMV